MTVTAPGQRATEVVTPPVLPSVAVVVPVHRSSAAFTSCLDHLRALDPAPTELIVVVDGADAAVADEAAAAGARTIVQTPQSGPAVARNTGAVRAASDVILFLDADVTAPPDIVRRVAEAFAADPGLSAAIGSYDDRPPADTLAAQYTNLRHHYVHQRARADGFTFWGACGAIRRDAFVAAGGFDEDYVSPSIEDIELGYRLREAGHRIRVVKDLQVTHLKRWTVRSLLTTDLVHRALPWSSLILRMRRLDDDLNVTLAERAKAALTVLAVAAAAGSVAAGRPALATPALAAVAVVVAWNLPFTRFLARRGGPALALFGAAWHLLYHLYSAVGFAAASLRHLVFGPQPVTEPWPGSPRRWTPGARHGATAPAGDVVTSYEAVTVGHRTARASATVVGDELLVRSRQVRRWVPAAALVVAGAALLVLFPGQRADVHVDGLAYLQIAEHYAAGDWGRAVNGYWGPLCSWLLAPLIALGADPLVAAELVQLGVGAGTVVALRRLCLSCGVRTATADGLALVTVPLVLHLAFQNVYADLLVAMLLLLFCSEIVPTAGDRTRGHTWRAGVWAGLAFLAKPYALPVVVVVVAARAVVVARRHGGPVPGVRPWRDGAVTLATMAAIVLPWLVVLSAHYGEPTVSRSIGYNVAVVAPGSTGQPMTRGLVEPDGSSSLFAWEDPSTMHLDSDGWSVSRDAAQRLASNVAANVGEGASLLIERFGAVVAFALAGAVALVRHPHLRHPRDPRVPRPEGAWLVLSFAIGIYLTGYLLTMVQARYLWFAVLALTPFAATALDWPLLRPSMSSATTTRPGYSAWRLAGFVLLAVLVAGQAALGPLRAGEGRDIASTADAVAAAGVDLTGLRVASADDWEATSALCFHLGCTYLGETDVPTGASASDAARAAAEVRDHADVYLVWTAGPDDAVGKPPAAPLGPLLTEVDGLVVQAVSSAAAISSSP